MMQFEHRKPRTGTEGTLDLLRTGVILVEPGGRVVFANTAASQVLGIADGLEVSGGLLVATASDSESRLADRLTAAFARPRSFDRSSLCVSRDPGIPGLQVTIVAAAGAPACATVLVTDPVADISTAAPRLRELYGLTGAESSVAVLIASGHDVASAAAQREVSRETVRWLLKRCFEKMGVRRQLDLTRLVLASAPVLASS
jgi:DNA-binding CsgD family transcriptional regulator